jgi:hypothetical protein
LPPRGRRDALRNLQERGIMTVEPLRDHVPHATIRKRFLTGADILSGTIGGLRQFGTQHGGDNVFFSMVNQLRPNASSRATLPLVVGHT